MKALLPIAAVALAFSLFAQDPSPAFAEERAAAHQAAKDYVEGFYLAKPELLERGVHPELDKFGYWHNAEEGAWTGPHLMTFTEATELAATWNKDGQRGELRPFTIEVLDVMDTMASVKLTAEWGVDYMQVAKFGERWQVRQVMWQSHTPGEK